MWKQHIIFWFLPSAVASSVMEENIKANIDRFSKLYLISAVVDKRMRLKTVNRNLPNITLSQRYLFFSPMKNIYFGCKVIALQIVMKNVVCASPGIYAVNHNYVRLKWVYQISVLNTQLTLTSNYIYKISIESDLKTDIFL